MEQMSSKENQFKRGVCFVFQTKHGKTWLT